MLLAFMGTVIIFCAGATAEARDWLPELRKVATKAVMARNGYRADQLEVMLHRVRVPKRFNLATGVRAAVPQYDDAIGPVTLRAIFTRNGKDLGSTPLPIRVKVFANVLMTNRRIGRKEVIRPADLRNERVEITKLVKWVMTDSKAVVGKWATRTVNAGQIVDNRWVADVPLIRKGDRVSLTYQAGSVYVSSNVTAMEDGYQDQQIRVKNERSKRLLTALVIDEETVEPIR